MSEIEELARDLARGVTKVIPFEQMSPFQREQVVQVAEHLHALGYRKIPDDKVVMPREPSGDNVRHIACAIYEEHSNKAFHRDQPWPPGEPYLGYMLAVSRAAYDAMIEASLNEATHTEFSPESVKYLSEIVGTKENGDG